jgi:ribosomal protein S18 acetylase RimI-like enzyme
MIIRPAEDKDRGILTSLHYLEDLEICDHEREVPPTGLLSSLSSRTRDIILVAEDGDGEVRGYLWAVALRIFDFKIGIIFDLFVDSKMRHKGFGRKLLQRGVDELRQLGVGRIWAHTEKKNAPTMALLEHIGFKQLEEEVFYQLEAEDAQHEWGKD